MKVTKEKTENSQAFLTVEMEPAEVEASLQKAYQRLVKKANIPGFRKGKAPRTLVERYLGKESLLEDALNSLIPEAYEKAVKEQDLSPIAQPQLELAQTEPVIFKAVVPLLPQVTLGDYHSIKVAPEPVKLSEEDVDHVIEHLRHQHAVWEPAERPVAFDDLLTLGIKSEVEGKPFINQEGVQLQVRKESNFPAPGFVDQLVGMSRGEEKEFKLSLPADYSRIEFAGKEGAFRVKVNEIKQEKLPEVNDEFVKEVAPECQNVPALREKITAELKKNAEERARLDYEEKVVQSAVDIAKLEYPPVLVEREITRLLNQQLQYLQMSGVNIEDYLKNIKKTPEELREDLRPRAVKRVTQSLVLEKVAEAEKVEVTDAEIDSEIEAIVQGTAENKREEMRTSLKSPANRESIKDMLLVRKAAQRLIEIAKSSYTENKEETKEKETKNE